MLAVLPAARSLAGAAARAPQAWAPLAVGLVHRDVATKIPTPTSPSVPKADIDVREAGPCATAARRAMPGASLTRRPSCACECGAGARGARVQRSKLKVVKTTTPKPLLPNDQLVFGRTFSDHMLEIPWTASAGWDAPVISPYHKLSLEPSASVFHYASEVRSAQHTDRLPRPRNQRAACHTPAAPAAPAAL